MCGIAGVYGCPQFTSQDVAGMIDTIAYRGADEQDVVTVDRAMLGHARLAIVDKENGGQPMCNTDGTVWVVFNGEIYNFVELREELKAKGYHFKSRCDTEVLVHLWDEMGEAMLDRLVGMFAFFIWDEKQQYGMLARDRQGIKPCYLMDIGDGFAFASEIKALFALPGITPEIDDVGLGLVHSFNYCPPPRTCFKGVTHLEAGSYMLIHRDGRRETKRYWDWPLTNEKAPLDADELSWLLDEAIRIQMRFDVLGCMFLSGGVDSSIVAAHLKPQWNQPSIQAFGLDCTVPGYGEFAQAQIAAAAVGVDLTPVQYDESIVPDSIEKVLFHTDQPHGDFSFLLIRRLCEAAHASGAIVAFTGDGPDEILSGFAHNEEFFFNQVRTNFPLGEYFSRIDYMPAASRSRLLTPSFRAELPEPVEVFEQMLSPWRHLDPVDQIAAYETNYLGPGNNLIKTDRMGAGLSIEARSPFLDHRVAEALARVPRTQKLRDGFGKYILKEYGTRYFDNDFMFRKKSMPTLPIGEWLKGPLHSWAGATLGDLDPSRYQVSNALQMLDDHRQGIANHTRELRTLLTTSVWMKGLG